MHRLASLVFLAPMCLSACASTPSPAPDDPVMQAFRPPSMEEIRKAAKAPMAELPGEVRVQKFAQLAGRLGDVMEDGGDAPFVRARAVFQIVYPNSTILIDSGMDRTLHMELGGDAEAFDDAAYAAVQQGLREAKLVVITHEHADHVAGVLGVPARQELADKTILSKEQVDTLIEHPRIPRVALSEEDSRAYRVFEYRRLVALAPGLVLIKTPGHTPGSQMLFVHLADGRELLFVGDAVWALAAVEARRQKPKAVRLKLREEPLQVLSQLRWLHDLQAQTDVLLVPSHDDAVLRQYARDGVMDEGLQLAQ